MWENHGNTNRMSTQKTQTQLQKLVHHAEKKGVSYVFIRVLETTSQCHLFSIIHSLLSGDSEAALVAFSRVPLTW